MVENPEVSPRVPGSDRCMHSIQDLKVETLSLANLCGHVVPEIWSSNREGTSLDRGPTVCYKKCQSIRRPIQVLAILTGEQKTEIYMMVKM